MFNSAKCLFGREIGRPFSGDFYDSIAENALIESSLLAKALSLPPASKTTFFMAISPDGQLIASAHGDHSIYVCNVLDGKLVHRLTGHPRSPWTLAFHPSRSDLLASGCLGGEVRVWDLKTGCSEKLSLDNNDDVPSALSTNTGSETAGSVVYTTTTAIASVAFHPDERLLVIAAADRLIFWDWADKFPRNECRTATTRERVRYVKFDKTGVLYTGITNSSGHAASSRPNVEREISRPVATSSPLASPARSHDVLSSRNEILQMRAELLRRHEQLLQRYNDLLRQFQELRDRYPEGQSMNSPLRLHAVPPPPSPPPPSLFSRYFDSDDHRGHGRRQFTSLMEENRRDIPAETDPPRFLGRVRSSGNSLDSDSIEIDIQAIRSADVAESSNFIPLSLSPEQVERGASDTAPNAEPGDQRKETTASVRSKRVENVTVSPLRKRPTDGSSGQSSTSDSGSHDSPTSIRLPAQQPVVNLNPSRTMETRDLSGGASYRIVYSPPHYSGQQRDVNPMNNDQSSSVNTSDCAMPIKRRRLHFAVPEENSGQTSTSRQPWDLNRAYRNLPAAGEVRCYFGHTARAVTSVPTTASSVSSVPGTASLVSSVPGTASLASSVSTTASSVSSVSTTASSASSVPSTASSVSSVPSTASSVSSVPGTANQTTTTNWSQGTTSQRPSRQPNIVLYVPRESSRLSPTNEGMSLLQQRRLNQQSISGGNALFGHRRHRMIGSPPRFERLPTGRNSATQAFMRRYLPEFGEGTSGMSRQNNIGEHNPNGNQNNNNDEEWDHLYDLNRAVNRAIAGAFIGAGDAAMANNILDMTCRIQRWTPNISMGKYPDLTSANSNVILSKCKLHNDGSVGMNENGTLLAAFVENSGPDRSLWAHTTLKIISLRPNDRGVVLYEKTFGPNAISVSFSPASGRHVLIGLASRRYLRLRHSPQTCAMIFSLPDESRAKKINEKRSPKELKLAMNVEHDQRQNGSVSGGGVVGYMDDGSNLLALGLGLRVDSVNCAIWLPTPGQGLCYGTNRGQIFILTPKREESDQTQSENGGHVLPRSSLSGSFQRQLARWNVFADPQSTGPNENELLAGNGHLI